MQQNSLEFGIILPSGQFLLMLFSPFSLINQPLFFHPFSGLLTDMVNFGLDLVLEAAALRENFRGKLILSVADLIYLSVFILLEFFGFEADASGGVRDGG